jgi:hypothetical protein
MIENFIIGIFIFIIGFICGAARERVLNNLKNKL